MITDKYEPITLDVNQQSSALNHISRMTHKQLTTIYFIAVLPNNMLFTFWNVKPLAVNTRKPCYRKENRAMHPVYGCPEKFRESLATPSRPRLLFPKLLMGFCCNRMKVHAKFEVRSFTRS